MFTSKRCKNIGVKPIPFRPKRARGIDLDSGKHLPLFKVIFNAQMLGKTGVKVCRSPSPFKTGYHVSCNEGFTEHEAMILGDCRGRIKYWEEQGYTFTFMNRHKKTGKIIGREELYDPLSLPFWSVWSK